MLLQLILYIALDGAASGGSSSDASANNCARRPGRVNCIFIVCIYCVRWEQVKSKELVKIWIKLMCAQRPKESRARTVFCVCAALIAHMMPKQTYTPHNCRITRKRGECARERLLLEYGGGWCLICDRAYVCGVDFLLSAPPAMVMCGVGCVRLYGEKIVATDKRSHNEDV